MTTRSLITLDNTDGVTLAASLAALDADTRAQLRHAMTALNERDDVDRLVGLIRDTLDDRDLSGRTPVGVLFSDHDDYTNGVHLRSQGVVLFTDGTTDTVTFENADDLLGDLFDSVSYDLGVTADLRTGQLGSGTDLNVHAAFGIAKPAAGDQADDVIEVQA